jgi:hypothetical protein
MILTLTFLYKERHDINLDISLYHLVHDACQVN